VVFAGGGLFAIKLRACVLWFLVFKWLKFLNPAAEFRFEHQGVDQNLNGLAKKLTQWTFAKADFISVRDKNSEKALRSLNISKIELTKDRVWLWLQVLVKDLKLSFNYQAGSDGVILFNALDFCEKDIFAVEHLRTHKTVKFVAFAPSDLKFAPLGVQTILPKTQQEVFNLFLSSELAIGERLHFMIVAQCFSESAADVFLLRASYSEKVASFVDEHQITYFSTLLKQDQSL
jgi:polysaccharide pyruvyl transferase WcaK-like protein